MGPYCRFCQWRCFVPIPLDATPEAREALREAVVSLLATCRGGQAFDRELHGWNYDRIKEAADVVDNVL